MSQYTVVVADALCARFFALKESLTPEIESSPRLVERGCLMNPEKQKSGSPRRGNPANGRAFEDHRERRGMEDQRHFTGMIVKESMKQIRKEDAHSLILVADRKTLGFIRENLAAIKTNGLVIRECDRDLTGETPVKIQELLAKRKLGPALKKPVQRTRK